MSFSSVLPTPQVLLKSGGVAAPPPPALTGTDSATGADTLVSLTVAVSAAEARVGVDAVTLCAASLLPAPDTARTLDALTALLATLKPAPDSALATEALTQYYALVTPVPDIGRGGDLLTLLYTGVIYAFDSSMRTVETVTSLEALVPATDTARSLEMVIQYGLSVFGYLLRLVSKGDIILPDDQNTLVYAWRKLLEALDRVRANIAEGKPDAAPTVDAYISEIRTLVDKMPEVKEGDPVYSEHFNLHVRALNKFFELIDWIANNVCTAVAKLRDALFWAQLAVMLLWEKRTGDIVASSDWNAVKQAFSNAPYLSDLAACFVIVKERRKITLLAVVPKVVRLDRKIPTAEARVPPVQRLDRKIPTAEARVPPVARLDRKIPQPAVEFPSVTRIDKSLAPTVTYTIT
jgi:predicted phosphatase